MSRLANVLTLIALVAVAGIAHADGNYYQVTYPASDDPGKLSIGVTHTLWVPPETTTIRGIIVHQHGCGVGACRGGETAAYDLHWQELARKWNCALLGPSYHQAEDQDCWLWCDPRNGSSSVFVDALVQLAKKSGHSEIAEVPWCLWGHSGGGFWASLMQMEYPERIVAIWFQSGTAYSRWVSDEIEAPEIPEAAMRIPMMANPGLQERDHEQFHSAWAGSLDMFRDYRARGAPIAFTPDPKSGHETRDSRYLAIPFFDACLAQRLPEKAGTSGSLREMDPTQVWLAAVPTEPEKFVPEPVPAEDYPGDPLEAVWLPDERVAKAWQEFVQTGAVGDVTPPPAPTDIRSEKSDDGMAITWRARADFESGIARFQILRDGQIIGQVPHDSASRYGRPLFQSMSYHDTPETPLPEMRFVDENGSPSSQYSVRTVNSVGLLSPAAD